jgi:hypothetical protein
MIDERLGDRHPQKILPIPGGREVELYEAIRIAGLRKAELARRLRWHMPQVDRLLSLSHGSPSSIFEGQAPAARESSE